ncbi:hypothetical protein FQZ97_851070 [compost metagenome]
MIYQLNLENNVIIIKQSKIRENNKQLKKLSRILKLSERVLFIPNLRSSFCSDVILLLFLRLFSLKRVNVLGVGEVSSQVGLNYIDNIKYNKYFVLDDGFNSVIVQSYIIKGINLYDVTKESKKYRKRINLIIRILLLKKTSLNKVTWFSCFNMTPVYGQEIIKNNFLNVKISLSENDIQDISEEKNVYYLGAPLSLLHSPYLTLDQELCLIGGLKKYLESRNKRLIYCIHRRESLEKINIIKERLGELELRHSVYPVELDFYMTKTPVAEIEGIISTALITLNNIYNVRNTYLINCGYMINESKREAFVKIRNELERNLDNITNIN